MRRIARVSTPRAPEAQESSSSTLLSSSDHCERAANELRRAHAATARIERRAHGLLGIDARVAERDERAHRIFGVRSLGTRSGVCTGLQLVELVGEIEDELLGFLAAHARDALQG